MSAKRKRKEPVKFIDLFAGIGGFHLAFHEHGARCVFESEWDKHARATYERNFERISPEVFSTNNFVGDITKVSPQNIPDFNVLTGGFPCQPFSNAGLKKGFADTRGTLFFDVARIINYHRPKVVFLENVKRFKTHDGGNTFEVVKNTLEEMGYEVHANVLNAKNFGVPQNRERIYIIGFLGKTNFKFPEGNKKVKVGDILERKVDQKYTISDKLWAGHKRRKAEHKRKGNGFGYCMVNEKSEYTNTISARYYKDGSEILIEQKNKNPRKLTPREAARLQGFPEDFVIPVSDNQAYKQFGNSVAVPVIKELAKRVIAEMENLEKIETKYQKI